MNNQKKISNPWYHLSKETHNNLREVANTLNYFNIIEISVILFFSYIAYELIFFVMEQVTLGNNHLVLGALSTGVFIPLVGGIWKMLESINNTYKNH